MNNFDKFIDWIKLNKSTQIDLSTLKKIVL